MNESKKNFKSTVGWNSDATVDTVDIKNWYITHIFFCIFTVDAVDIKKNIYLPIFFLYFAVDAVDNWKNMNESKKNFKSTVAWMSDDAVDTVDIKQIEESLNFFLILPLTPLT